MLKIKNKNIILTFIITFFIMIISFILSNTELFKAIFSRNYNPFPDLKTMVLYLYSYDIYMIFGSINMQLIIPIIATLATYNLFVEKQGLLFHKCYRENNYKKTILKTIFCYALIISCAIFLAFLLYYIIGFVFPINYDLNLQREVFKDIFGSDFFNNYRYLYYFLEGILKYFIIPFIYSLFGLIVALLANKKYMSIVIPSAYYLVFTVIFQALPFETSIYFAPNIIMGAGSMVDPSTIKLFLSLIPPLTIIIILLSFYLSRSQKIET